MCVREGCVCEQGVCVREVCVCVRGRSMCMWQ